MVFLHEFLLNNLSFILNTLHRSCNNISFPQRLLHNFFLMTDKLVVWNNSLKHFFPFINWRDAPLSQLVIFCNELTDILLETLNFVIVMRINLTYLRLIIFYCSKYLWIWLIWYSAFITTRIKQCIDLFEGLLWSNLIFFQ